MATAKRRSKKEKYLDLVLFVVMMALFCIVFMNRDSMFLGRNYEFKAVASAFYGSQNGKYVIDEGKKAIDIIGDGNVLSRRLQGGRYNRFYYAQSVAEGIRDGKKAIYISDIAYKDAEEGTVEEQRIVEYRAGKYRQIYNAHDKQIYEIRFKEGSLFVLQEEEYGLVLLEIRDDRVKVIRRLYCGDVLKSATVDTTTECVAIATKRGAVRVMRKDSEEWETLQHDKEHLMPQGICGEDGIIYYSDLYTGSLCRFSETDPSDPETVFQKDGLKINDLSVSADGKNVLCCDQVSFYELHATDDGMMDGAYVREMNYGGFPVTVLLWCSLVIAALLMIWMLRYLPRRIVTVLHNESALRMTTVVFAVVTVSCFIAWSLISEQNQKEDLWDVSDMKLVTDLVVNNLDVELLNDLKSESDYGGSSYMKLRDKLDLLMAEALEENKDYYYVFYRMQDGKLCYLLNFFDTVTCTEPCGLIDETYYLDVYKSRRSYALKSQDHDGQWLYVLTPVENEDGECVAVLEIGTDLSYRTAERWSQTWNTALSVFCSSAVMMMLIVEVLFLLTFFEKKRDYKGEGKKDVTHQVPLRTITMLSYAAATLQDSFVTVLSSRLYRGNLPVPDSVAAGLPLSGNLLMMAGFAIVGGHMSEKLGSKKTFYAGITTEIVGFLTCAVFGNYAGLLIGNIFMGIGLGLINVTCNALAAMGEDTETVAQAFADVQSGVLSALAVGAGLAALLFPIGGGRLTYSVSACFMIPVIFLVRTSMDVRPDEAEEEDTSEKMTFGRFFCNWRVLGFLAMILVPFMSSISYREYFFPMFATENGFTEGRIGQIYMICGLLVIYVGPHISSYVIGRFGTFKSIIIASVAMGINMLLFVLFPSLVTAVLGMILLSTITSFAYTCQYTYFEELPDSQRYGSGKSMGVYSVFENLGQTVGPVVYGTLLTLGYRKGIGLFSVLMLLFTGIYMVGFFHKRRKAPA